MPALLGFLRSNTLTPARAPKQLGVTPPRVSALVRGKIHLFSIDNLDNLHAAAGLRVDVSVKRVA
jgi:predicted XRE-type DNA-binding protein